MCRAPYQSKFDRCELTLSLELSGSLLFYMIMPRLSISDSASTLEWSGDLQKRDSSRWVKAFFDVLPNRFFKDRVKCALYANNSGLFQVLFYKNLRTRGYALRNTQCVKYFENKLIIELQLPLKSPENLLALQ